MTITEAEAFWEDRYAGEGRSWSGRPNAVLEEVAAQLTPGRALDLGAGEGGDAVWLAQRGWRVTAVDVSANALRRVHELAGERGVADRITTERHELGVSLPGGEFDLVTAHFLLTPVAWDRSAALRAVAEQVVVGGRLLLVDHGSGAPWMWNVEDAAFPTPAGMWADLGLDPQRWTAERLDTPERIATGPDGTTAPLLDAVVLARRTA